MSCLLGQARPPRQALQSQSGQEYCRAVVKLLHRITIQAMMSLSASYHIIKRYKGTNFYPVNAIFPLQSVAIAGHRGMPRKNPCAP